MRVGAAVVLILVAGACADTEDATRADTTSVNATTVATAAPATNGAVGEQVSDDAIETALDLLAAYGNADVDTYLRIFGEATRLGRSWTLEESETLFGFLTGIGTRHEDPVCEVLGPHESTGGLAVKCEFSSGDAVMDALGVEVRGTSTSVVKDGKVIEALDGAMTRTPDPERFVEEFLDEHYPEEVAEACFAVEILGSECAAVYMAHLDEVAAAWEESQP